MDPTMKLLEEDEFVASFASFTVAALNRDIEGSTCISHSVTAMMPQGSNQMSSLYSQWQPSTQDGSGSTQSQIYSMDLDQQAKHSADLDTKTNNSGAESQKQEANAPHVPNNSGDHDQKEEQNALNLSQSFGMLNLDKSHNQIQDPGPLQHPSREAQSSNVHSQSGSVPEQAGRTKKIIPFRSLLPFILPELDRDRAMQLQRLYTKLRKNEIPKEEFVKLMRSTLGDEMLKAAVVKMQSKIARESQPGPKSTNAAT